MFSALVKTRFQWMWSSLFRGRSSAKKRGPVFKLLAALLAVYVVGAMMLMFGAMFSGVCAAFCEAGLSWLYFTVAAIMCFALCFIGSIFTTQNQIYNARDNELLLSMPVPPAYILASRLVLLFAVNMIYGGIVMVPAGVVYLMYNAPDLVGVVFYIIEFLLLQLLVMAVSCFVGWIVALITSRMRRKNIITLILSVLFLGAYFVVYSRIQSYIAMLVANGAAIADAIRKGFAPAFYYGDAIANGSVVSLLLFALCSVLPFALVYALLSRGFVRIATERRTAAKVVYRERTMKQSGALSALVGKELTHFVSNPMYILNACMGVVFSLVGAVFLVVKAGTLNALLAQAELAPTMLMPLLILAVSGLATMNFISAPSVSLEGKNLWISQSIPVDASAVLMAKALTHIVICLPASLVASVVCAVIVPADALSLVLLFLLPVVTNVFAAFFGLIINLRFPRFDWISEVVVIKQGMSTMIAMFASMGVVIVPAMLYGFLLSPFLSPQVFMLICLAAFALVTLLMWRYLMTRGARVFESL